MVPLDDRRVSLKAFLRPILILLALSCIHIGAVIVPLVPSVPELPVSGPEAAVPLWEDILTSADLRAVSGEGNWMAFLEMSLRAHRRISVSS